MSWLFALMMAGSPPPKGGADKLVPCAKCRAPILVRRAADGTTVRLNPDGSPHVH